MSRVTSGAIHVSVLSQRDHGTSGLTTGGIPLPLELGVLPDAGRAPDVGARVPDVDLASGRAGFASGAAPAVSFALRPTPESLLSTQGRTTPRSLLLRKCSRFILGFEQF